MFGPATNLVDLFRDEARESLRSLIAGALTIESGKADSTLLATMFRDAHTIKGGARLLDFVKIADATEVVESRIQGLRDGALPADREQGTLLLGEIDLLNRKVEDIGDDSSGTAAPSESFNTLVHIGEEPGTQKSRTTHDDAIEIDGLKDRLPQTDSTVRVRTERIDHLVALVSEARRIASVGSSGNPLTSRDAALTEILSAAEAAALRLRLVPVGGMFDNLRRAVRDSARDDGKEAELKTTGGDVEADGAIVDSAAEIVLQLIRNAVAHGLELPAERESNGKPIRGTVRLELRARSHWLEIVVADDGRGIDSEAVRAKARERGLESSRSIRELIFSPGLSTRTAKDALGGQGIGLDIVDARCREIGGEVDIDWVPGEGTTFSVRIPVTALFERLVTGTIDGQLVGIQADLVERIEIVNLGIQPELIARGLAGTSEIDSISFDDYPTELSALTVPLGALFASATISRRGWIAADGRVGLILDLD